jgi:hypothetical protein
MATDTRAEIEGLEDVFDIPTAAAAARVTPYVIRQAILAGELPAFIPGGRDPRRAGRGRGYRILKPALKAWLFGEDQPT